MQDEAIKEITKNLTGMAKAKGCRITLSQQILFVNMCEYVFSKGCPEDSPAFTLKKDAVAQKFGLSKAAASDALQALEEIGAIRQEEIKAMEAKGAEKVKIILNPELIGGTT